MKLEEALSVINKHESIQAKEGYMVFYKEEKWGIGSTEYKQDRFPDMETENLIETYAEAAVLAKRFLSANPYALEAYVIDQDFNKVGWVYSKK